MVVGRRKKKRLNARRQQERPITQPVPDPQASPNTSDYAPPVELRLEGVVLNESSLVDSPMLPYLRMVVSLIEGVELTCREVLNLLREAMRQHSIGACSKIDYLLGFWQRHPP